MFKLGMAKILIVGGGVIGTMHAYLALQAGHQVVQCEKDPQAQSASVRNFGLVWVSGRAKGAELELALRSRELWESIGTTVGTIGYRSNGSLTIAANPEELAAQLICLFPHVFISKSPWRVNAYEIIPAREGEHVADIEEQKRDCGHYDV